MCANNIAAQSHQRAVFPSRFKRTGAISKARRTLDSSLSSPPSSPRALTRFELFNIATRIMAANAVMTPAVFKKPGSCHSKPPQPFFINRQNRTCGQPPIERTFPEMTGRTGDLCDDEQPTENRDLKGTFHGAEISHRGPLSSKEPVYRRVLANLFRGLTSLTD